LLIDGKCKVLLALPSPLSHEYQWQPVDDDIQKTADKQAKNQPGEQDDRLVHDNREQFCQIA
jgi:hypothetical protein